MDPACCQLAELVELGLLYPELVPLDFELISASLGTSTLSLEVTEARAPG